MQNRSVSPALPLPFGKWLSWHRPPAEGRGYCVGAALRWETELSVRNRLKVVAATPNSVPYQVEPGTPAPVLLSGEELGWTIREAGPVPA